MRRWKFISGLLLLGVMNIAFAVDAYQVEIIIFSQYKADTLSSENWPDVDKSILNLHGAKDLLTLNSLGIKKVTASSYTLQKEFQRLKHFAPYQVLLHAAWRESLAEASEKQVFHLYGGHLYDDSGNILQSMNTESLEYAPSQNWELDGTMTITLRHYFEVDFNLLFAMPRAAYDSALHQLGSNDGEIFKYFSLNQNRRTRSGELNYVDHPLYGVLFKVTPIQENSVR